MNYIEKRYEQNCRMAGRLFDNMTITEDNLFGKLKYQGNE